jgi:hypothetical protein
MRSLRPLFLLVVCVLIMPASASEAAAQDGTQDAVLARGISKALA